MNNTSGVTTICQSQVKNSAPSENTIRDNEDRARDQEIVLGFYSHLSRLFVSSYAMFFTIYAAFIVFFYNVLIPRNFRGPLAAVVLFLLSLMILGLASIFYLRARGFSKAMQYIERNYLVLSTGTNVHTWFVSTLFPKRTWLDRLAHFLFERPEKLFAPSEVLVILTLIMSALFSLTWIALFIAN